jgi:glutamine phosphoribosylpyrophosphate amidotransferase
MQNLRPGRMPWQSCVQASPLAAPIPPALCIFEYVYFSQPPSVSSLARARGRNAHRRTRLCTTEIPLHRNCDITIARPGLQIMEGQMVNTVRQRCGARLAM